MPIRFSSVVTCSCNLSPDFISSARLLPHLNVPNRIAYGRLDPSLAEEFGGRTRARTWDPIIKKSAAPKASRLARETGFVNAAPVSRQKPCYRNKPDGIEQAYKRSKINEADRYSAAHNGQVAGSSPGEPFTISMADHLRSREGFAPGSEIRRSYYPE
jgi:hypothetical protein